VTTVSVAIAAHTWDRVAQVERCVASVHAGSRRPDQVMLVVDSAPELASHLRARLGTTADVRDSVGRGLSAARNTALAASTSDVIAFIDDDAVAQHHWLAELVAAFDVPNVVGAGGRIVPEYAPGAVPVPDELLWLVGATYLGHRIDAGPIDRPIGANMAFRVEDLRRIGGFDTAFGVVGAKRVNSNEEIVLCRQLLDEQSDGLIWYSPAAVVAHFVPAERTQLRYLVRRGWVEGRSKAAVRHRHGASSMSVDRAYARGILLPGLARHVRRVVVRHDRAALRQLTVFVTVPVVVAAGYLGARVARRAQDGRETGAG
jgi:glucosyl-dolichyl phosphate glucuronosyltransferase